MIQEQGLAQVAACLSMSGWGLLELTYLRTELTSELWERCLRLAQSQQSCAWPKSLLIALNQCVMVAVDQRPELSLMHPDLVAAAEFEGRLQAQAQERVQVAAAITARALSDHSVQRSTSRTGSST